MNKTTFTTLTGLRRLLPARAISYAEALAVAEKQANRLAASRRDSSVQEADLLGLTTIVVESSSAADDPGHSGSSRSCTRPTGPGTPRAGSRVSSLRARFPA